MGGKSSSTVVGYWYSWGLHMGLGRGEIDEFIEVKVGDRTAWTSHDSPITASSRIYIDAPELFGGERAEGGVQGWLDIMMGEKTQPVNGALAAMLGGLVPAFRGIATLFFDGRICCINPYPKPWKFRVRRSKKGWYGDVWYPETIDIWQCTDTKAMNPAHIIYECATNKVWGRGLPRTRIDHVSFTQAADRLFAECFGLCLRWNRTEDLGAFVQSIIDHIGGALYIDRGTGLLTLKLIRDDYDPAEVQNFTYGSGLLEISEDSASAADGLINEVIVTYHDAVTDEDRQVKVQNLASIQAQDGAINSHSVTYRGIACPDLALRIAQRDLRAGGLSLKRFKVSLDRRAWKIAPGTVFAISAPDKGLGVTYLRAGRIEDSTDGTGKITVTAVEDVYGLPDVAYTEVQPGGYKPPPTTLQSVGFAWAETASYRDTRRLMSNSDFAARTDDSAHILAYALKPDQYTVSFIPAISTTSSYSSEYEQKSATPFGVGGLFDPIDREDTVIKLHHIVDFNKALTELSKGGAAKIGTYEVVNVENVIDSDATAGWIRIQVGRGCIDTVPRDQRANSNALDGAFIMYERDYYADQREYIGPDSRYIRYLSKSFSKVQKVDEATSGSVDINDRFDRPYPPADFKIGGTPVRTDMAVYGDIVMTWAHRNRVTQADKMINTKAASITPEAGTTYTVVIKKASDLTVLHTATGITGTTWTYTDAQATTDGFELNIIVELSAERDGHESWTKHELTMKHYAGGGPTTGYGWDYGNDYGG